jgi:hypothetical protein
MNKTTAKLITIIAAAALLAGCGGGGSTGTSLPSAPQGSQPQQPAPDKVTTGLAIKVDVGAKKSSTSVRKTVSSSKHPFQITSDVTDLIVTVDSTPTDFVLATSPYCSQLGQTYTCGIAASVGSHTVSVTTNAGPTIVGYSLPVTGVSVAALSVTNVNFTVTPVAAAFASGESWTTPGLTASLPEDGNSYPVNVTADVLAPDGENISMPIDDVNLFGTVTVTTSPNTYTVTPPTQLTDPNYGDYNDSPYSFTYDGSEISGDQLIVNEAYTLNTSNSSATATAYNNAVTAPTSATPVASIPLTRLELPNAPNPAGASINGSVFDSSNSWYYIPPSSVQPEPNNTNSAVVVFNNVNPSQSAFVLHVRATNDLSGPSVSGSCSTASGTGGPIYTIGTTSGSTNGETGITINPPTSSGQSTSAACTLTVADGTFSTLMQSVTVYPSTSSLSIGIHAVHRP